MSSASWVWLLVVVLWVALGLGCDSNPTPHPGQPDARGNETTGYEDDDDQVATPSADAVDAHTDTSMDPTNGFSDAAEGCGDTDANASDTDAGPTDTSDATDTKDPDAQKPDGASPCPEPTSGEANDSDRSPASGTPLPVGGG